MLKKVRKWLHKHRKAVFITATVLAVTGSVAILLIKGKKVEVPVDKLAERIIPDVTPVANTVAEKASEVVAGEVITFPREAFVRRLPEGWKPSPEKIAQAKALNIPLQPGETLVDACTVTMRIPS